jgi:hypothetical protein
MTEEKEKSFQELPISFQNLVVLLERLILAHLLTPANQQEDESN